MFIFVDNSIAVSEEFTAIVEVEHSSSIDSDSSSVSGSSSSFWSGDDSSGDSIVSFDIQGNIVSGWMLYVIVGESQEASNRFANLDT